MWISLIKHSTWSDNGFFIPPANKIWEDIYESPCPLVDAVVYSSYLYYGVTLYTKIVYNLMVFQDFDPRSFKQVHGHGSKSALFVSGLYLSYGETLEISTSHKHKDVPWF